jgi:DNA phosphorothioation-dependent restriction protein DptG
MLLLDVNLIFFIFVIILTRWYGVMKQTWEESTEKRPTFKEIRSTLDEIFVAAPSDDYYYYRNKMQKELTKQDWIRFILICKLLWV